MANIHCEIQCFYFSFHCSIAVLLLGIEQFYYHTDRHTRDMTHLIPEVSEYPNHPDIVKYQ